MKKSIRNKWLKALRSGDYNQGKHSLCRTTSTRKDAQVEFCCLGVLINETEGFDKLPGEPQTTFGDKRHAFQGDKVSMPTGVFLKHIGLSTSAARSLANMNDGGADFKSIADYIEKKEL